MKFDTEERLTLEIVTHEDGNTHLHRFTSEHETKADTGSRGPDALSLGYLVGEALSAVSLGVIGGLDRDMFIAGLDDGVVWDEPKERKARE